MDTNARLVRADQSANLKTPSRSNGKNGQQFPSAAPNGASREAVAAIRPDLYPTGRKHCSRCGRWRPVSDFGVRAPTTGYLKAQCRTCEAVTRRERNGGRPWYVRQERCKRGHLLDETAYVYPDGRRDCRVCERDHRPGGRLKGEYHRIYQEGKRREAGAQRRDFSKRQTPRASGERTTVPTGPFAEWLRGLILELGIGETMVRTGLSQRTIYALLNERPTVHIDTVDAALIREGSMLLMELYPELYDFEDEAVAA